MVSCRLNIIWPNGGGGQVVSVLAFYYNDLSLNPLRSSIFLCKLLEQNENKQNEADTAH